MKQKPFRGIQLNKTHPLALRMSNAWLFNECTGNQVTDIVEKRVANAYNTSYVKWRSGPNGPAVDFTNYFSNGSGYFVSDTSPAWLDSISEISLVTWVYVYSSGLSRLVGPISLRRGDGYSDTNLMSISWSPSGTAWIGFLIDGAGTLTTTDFNSNGWNHVVCTFGNTERKLYVNGELKASDSGVSAPGFPVEKIWLGRVSHAGGTKVESLYIYKKVLNASDVSSLYHDNYQMFESKTPPFSVTSGGTSDTETPSSLALSLALNSPNVSATQSPTETPTTQSLALGLASPTISVVQNQTETPSAQALSLALNNPTIDVTDIVLPEAQTLSLTLNSPSVSAIQNQTETPSAQSLAMSLGSPTLDITGSGTQSPATQSLSLSLNNPTVVAVQNITATPSAQGLTLTLNSPEVLAGIAPSAQALSLTLNDPTVVPIQNQTETPSALSLALTLNDPTIVSSSGRTYVVYENNYLSVVVGGTEVARFKANGDIDVNGVANDNAF